MHRRTLLQGGIAAILGSACSRHHARSGSPEHPQRYVQTAVGAGKWIRSCTVQTEHGLAWPQTPGASQRISTDLYSGTSGVVLFLVELYRATGDSSWLADARGGGDHLIGALGDKLSPPQTGLYAGAAGVGFVLHRLYLATGEEKYRRGAMRAVELLHQHAQSAGDGVEWNSYTDVVFGGAGIGLFLVYAARAMGHPESLELARRTGRRLLELGIESDKGLHWRMSPTADRVYPNFSHGTSGVAYFLATLFCETREPRFVEGSLKGASYLQSIAVTEGNVCLLFRNEPDARNIYYLGWCHGPAGTGRLFYQLWQATGDRAWKEWLGRAARGILKSGIPEKRTPGFWNNVGQCCGSASVADFFLNLYLESESTEYLDFVERMTSEILAKAERDPDGKVKWTHAEFRVKPEQVAAQTGYMQGAAGIGTCLLRLAAFEQRRDWSLVLPDSPFLPSRLGVAPARTLLPQATATAPIASEL